MVPFKEVSLRLNGLVCKKSMFLLSGQRKREADGSSKSSTRRKMRVSREFCPSVLSESASLCFVSWATSNTRNRALSVGDGGAECRSLLAVYVGNLSLSGSKRRSPSLRVNEPTHTHRHRHRQIGRQLARQTAIDRSTGRGR